jgi:hypothetical protein
MDGNLCPKIARDFSQIRQHHFPIRDIPQHAFPFADADGDEIRARLGVIVSSQADGPAVMLFWIVDHFPFAQLT